MSIAVKQRSIIPGFGLTLGYTLVYLCLIVLIPLVTLPVKTASAGWDAFWQTITDPRVVASYKLSLTSSLFAATVNAIFGAIVAWVLVRYEFPGRKIVDAFIDLPFALPTAVAGITLTTLYAPNGLLGAPLADYGIKVASTGNRYPLDPATVRDALVRRERDAGHRETDENSDGDEAPELAS